MSLFNYFNKREHKTIDEDNGQQPKYVKVALDSLPVDPAERPSIDFYHVNQRDEIRRSYLQKGPCQPQNHSFPQRDFGGKLRRFNSSWFNDNKYWLEYSIKEDAAFCLCCYLFKSNIPNQGGSDNFVKFGFKAWNRKVGLDCHKAGNPHTIVVKMCQSLMNQKQSITAAYFNGISKRKGSQVSNLHHYRVDAFKKVIDMQLQELKHRFNEVNTNLLISIACLCPSESFKAFDLNKLMKMARHYAEESPTECDIRVLELELKSYIADMREDGLFNQLKGIGELAKKMVEFQKHIIFPKVYLLLKLALILPVATASVEHAFSAMKLIKTDIRNKIGDQFLSDSLFSYVEKAV